MMSCGCTTRLANIAFSQWKLLCLVCSKSIEYTLQDNDEDSDDDAPVAVSLSTAREAAKAAQEAVLAQQTLEREQAKEKRRVCSHTGLGLADIMFLGAICFYDFA